MIVVLYSGCLSLVDCQSLHSLAVTISNFLHITDFNSNGEFRSTKVPVLNVCTCRLRLRVALCHDQLEPRHRLLYLLLRGQIHYQQIQDILLKNLLDDALLPLASWPSWLSGPSWCSATSHSPFVSILPPQRPSILSSSAALLAPGSRVDITTCEQGDQRPAVSSMVGVAEARGEGWARVCRNGKR